MADERDRSLRSLDSMAPSTQRVTIWSAVKEGNFEFTSGRHIETYDERRNRTWRGRRWNTMFKPRDLSRSRYVGIKHKKKRKWAGPSLRGRLIPLRRSSRNKHNGKAPYQDRISWINTIVAGERYILCGYPHSSSRGVVAFNWYWNGHLYSYGWKIQTRFHTLKSKENNSAHEPLSQNSWAPRCTNNIRYIITYNVGIIGTQWQWNVMWQLDDALNLLVKESS